MWRVYGAGKDLVHGGGSAVGRLRAMWGPTWFDDLPSVSIPGEVDPTFWLVPGAPSFHRPIPNHRRDPAFPAIASHPFFGLARWNNPEILALF
jgi:hypothetical protein